MVGRVVRGIPNSATHGRSGSGGGFSELMVPNGGGGGARLRPQQSLPSLKASGLLDSWKPPTEAFAQAMSISRELLRILFMRTNLLSEILLASMR